MNENGILERLDIMISLLLPEFREEKYEFKGVKLDIMRLCDYNHTIQDMIKILKKPRQQIDNSLSILRKEFFIRTIKKGDEIVYIRLK